MSQQLIAVDIGNDAVKSLAGNYEESIYIPNIIAKTEADRRIIEYEKNILDGFHVEITSSALKRKNGTYAVGNLAMKYHNNEELDLDTEKALNDQTIILLLTTLAYNAINRFEEDDGIIKANYILSTGLPLAENRYKQDFKKKLKEATHEVKFLKTPSLEGKTVVIQLNDMLINSEGYAAYMDLMMNQDGSDKNEDLQAKTLMINDIGGLSTDTAIITAEGTIDNTNSSGINEGVSPYLDEIIDRVYEEFKYRIKSRKELVNIITSTDPEEKNHIWVKSNRTSIEHIITPVMEKLALIEYTHMNRIWNQVPGIRYAYIIGGGALALQSYLTIINNDENRYAFKFLNEQDSIWMIARAYFKVLTLWCKKKGIEVPTLVTNE